MQWTDDGIVLGIKRHGESSAIAELLTRDHGRHLGLVRGGSGTRLKPVLQAGNSVRAVWRARLDDHLGTYSVETLTMRTGAVFASSYAVFGVGHLTSLARLLPERDPHLAVFTALEDILDGIGDLHAVAAKTVRFELQILSELGFGLDLDSCAVTGTSDDLAYVSPKSGRAVSRSGGEEWRDRLFRLPAFLRDDEAKPDADDIAAGFALTGYFIGRHVLEPRGSSFATEREHFLSALARGLKDAA